MKKYGLITLLSLSCISHAMAQPPQTADEYYEKAVEGTQQSETTNSETAESLYKSANATMQEIEAIKKRLEEIKSSSERKPEEVQVLQQALQLELSFLQAKLQADTLKIQSLAAIHAKTAKTTEEIHEEKAKEEHKETAKKLKEELDKARKGLKN
ncbi:type IV secretion system protein VirB5 [Bartonella gliris]|uniref:type IV secretion system protein VirB5 n=1 Tax=Bartonella gliris TaxID=3004109 RepID=UPI0038735C2C